MAVIYIMEEYELTMAAKFDTAENRGKAQKIFSAILGRDVGMYEIVCKKT